jgi:hypothetical protein
MAAGERWERQVDDTKAEEGTPDPAPARPRRSVSSKAMPYGTDEMASFFSEEWESPWEINHTVTPPR